MNSPTSKKQATATAATIEHISLLALAARLLQDCLKLSRSGAALRNCVQSVRRNRQPEQLYIKLYGMHRCTTTKLCMGQQGGIGIGTYRL